MLACICLHNCSVLITICTLMLLLLAKNERPCAIEISLGNWKNRVFFFFFCLGDEVELEGRWLALVCRILRLIHMNHFHTLCPSISCCGIGHHINKKDQKIKISNCFACIIKNYRNSEIYILLVVLFLISYFSDLVTEQMFLL